MSASRRFVPAVLVALFAVQPAFAATSADELISQVQSTYQNVSSIKANFVQTVHNPLTGKDEKKSGKISMERPRKVRIEVGAPLESAVVSDGATLWIYAAAQKQVIVQKDLDTSSGLGGLLDNLAQINTMFTVTLTSSGSTASDTVSLVPRTAGQYKSLTLTLSSDKHMLQELVLVDQMDNKTVMDFSNVVTNVDVPDSQFSFTAPAGTTVLDTGKL